MVKILILGGTHEARQLAEKLTQDSNFDVQFSLAGRTRQPDVPRCEVRVGGFGGADGLADFIEENDIGILVDATHPFADRITQNAATATAATGIACLRLERPAWKARPRDNWVLAESVIEAAAALPKGARVLVTVGRQEIAPFFDRLDIKVIARMIEPPDTRPRAPHKILLGRPPFREQDERLLMRTEHITHLVTKNSGGEATVAKLGAARALDVKVVMVKRPPAPNLPLAHTEDDMMRLVIAEAEKLSSA